MMWILVAILLTVFVVGVVLLRLYNSYTTEGFLDAYAATVPAGAFVPKVAPGPFDEGSALSPGLAMNPANEKLVESAALPAMGTKEAEANWGALTSEKCFRADIGEALKPTRNFLQRTNNYQRAHPDSCSAPNHEFIGTFYTPFEGVGRYPSTGMNFPPSTQCS